MGIQIGSDEPHPTHFWNTDGLQLRLQCFVIVRDEDDRVALVREKERPNVLNLPGETVIPNSNLDEMAGRVSELWFVDRLDTEVSQVLSWPAEDPNGKWYIVFLYEADKPADGLKMPDDTEEFVWVSTKGDPPGDLAMNHVDVWEQLAG